MCSRHSGVPSAWRTAHLKIIFHIIRYLFTRHRESYTFIILTIHEFPMKEISQNLAPSELYKLIYAPFTWI